LLKFESDLVYAPCYHGKMIDASHSPVNTMMTEHPGQLLHMDTVGSDMNGGSRSSVRRGNYRFGEDVTQSDPASNQHDSNPSIAAPLLL
jgi:hypothetical protein